MTGEPTNRPTPGGPAVLLYQLACLAGLGMIVVPQLSRGVRLLDLFVVLVGLLGLLTRWRLSPLAVLCLLAVSLMFRSIPWGVRGWAGRSQPFEATDFLLCCGALAYVAAHYRLQGLTSHILPLDPRRWQEGPRRNLLGRRQRLLVRQPRSPRLVTPAELPLLLLTLPLWALLAQLVWLWLVGRGSVLGLPFAASRFLLLAWLLGGAGLVVVTLFRTWRSRTMTPAEASLFLQDVLWRETRGEQRRLQRWLAWSALRRRRKEAT